MSTDPRWLIVLFSLTPPSLLFCLLDLSMPDRGVLESPLHSELAFLLQFYQILAQICWCSVVRATDIKNCYVFLANWLPFPNVMPLSINLIIFLALHWATAGSGLGRLSNPLWRNGSSLFLWGCFRWPAVIDRGTARNQPWNAKHQSQNSGPYPRPQPLPQWSSALAYPLYFLQWPPAVLPRVYGLFTLSGNLQMNFSSFEVSPGASRPLTAWLPCVPGPGSWGSELRPRGHPHPGSAGCGEGRTRPRARRGG